MSDMAVNNYPELESEVEDVAENGASRPVSSQPNDWNISTLRDKYERGKIDLQPHYQRDYVWELRPELPSRLIESVLLQIPIPPLYFVRLESDKIEVVDGQQRLTTLIRYVRNEFRLTKLEKLSHLNGKLFKELSEPDQERIADSTIRSIVIDAGGNSELRFEIFERLNRGTMALNEQEIRNCVYRGPFCDLLAELEQDANWRNVRGTAKPEPRFQEREMILRFFACSARIDHYRGNLKKFLNDYMGKFSPKDPAAIADLGGMFRQTMQNVFTVFGEHSGHLFGIDQQEPAESGTWANKFSISALDVQASALAGQPTQKVRAAAIAISKSYQLYLATNPDIRLAIGRRPSSTEATKTRWLGFKAVVLEILAGSATAGGAQDPLLEAQALNRAGYPAAAGMAAGVVLEDRLKDLCLEHSAVPAKALGIGSYNQALLDKGVFSAERFEHVRSMSRLRNRCGHAVPDPISGIEANELIDAVRELLKG